MRELPSGTRNVPFEGIENARDLGGLRMRDGRAGWGTAFLLAALGAESGTIVEDFALSNISYAPVVEQLSEKVLQKGGGENELRFIRSMAGVSVDNFERGLDLIDGKYGGMDRYLEKQLGFSSSQQNKLRDKYLEK